MFVLTDEEEQLFSDLDEFSWLKRRKKRAVSLWPRVSSWLTHYLIATCRSCGAKTMSWLVVFTQTPRSVFEEMKYLEIVIVTDHSMVSKCNLMVS